jgi:hypothetical protein
MYERLLAAVIGALCQSGVKMRKSLFAIADTLIEQAYVQR